jgi:hypothetical protein
VAVQAADPRQHRATGRGSTTVAHLVAAAQAMASEGQHDEAAALLRSAISLDPFRADARQMLRRCREAQLTSLYEAMPRAHVPKLVANKERLARLQLSPRERRLLAHVNGRWDVAALALTTALGELETLRALRRLLHAGVVRLDAL